MERDEGRRQQEKIPYTFQSILKTMMFYPKCDTKQSESSEQGNVWLGFNILKNHSEHPHETYSVDEWQNGSQEWK